jgi:hypothetical protein
MTRFHDSRFQGVRLVCRLRRSSANLTTGAPTGPAGASGSQPAVVEPGSESESANQHPSTVAEAKEDGSSTPLAKAPLAKDKFFIVKSLTVEDLELSLRNGVWATQSHNEDALNKAYEVR